MKFYEIDALVREHLPNHRLYDWRQIEQMRNDLAETGRLREQLRQRLRALDAAETP